MNIYNFIVKDGKNKEVSLTEYKNKVLLIVNTATECGFTPQYSDLQDLYKKLGNENFEILDFPCNQFGNQSPGNNEEIATFCNTRFGITFPIFSKIDVNGKNASPLFTYLKEQKGFDGFDKEHPLTKILEEVLSKADPNYKETSDIKWNFTKFLIDQKGNVIGRFEPMDDIEKISEAIAIILDVD
ncbi:MAG: glutathione peroxidase [Lachnospiraceae bacterium]